MGIDFYEEINFVYIKNVILKISKKKMASLLVSFRVFWLKY